MANAYELFGVLGGTAAPFQKMLRDSDAQLKNFDKQVEASNRRREQFAQRSALQQQRIDAQTSQARERIAAQTSQVQMRLAQQSNAVRERLSQQASQFQARSEQTVQKAVQQAELAKQRIAAQTTAQRERLAQQTSQFEIRMANQTAKAQEAAQRKAEAAFIKSNQSNSSFTQKLGLTVAAANLAGQAISILASSLHEAGSAVLSYSANLEQTKVGFATLLGSTEAATKHLKDLQVFAASTPFEFAGLAEASRRFQGVGVEAAKVIPLMRDIGNAASAAGASSEQLDRITLAFSQIIAKGKLSAEEVNQLAESGIPAWKLLSDTLGKSKEEVIKLAEQGKISSDVFLAAFQQFSQANFGDAMQKQSRTFNGAISNIKDSLMIAANTAFQPLYDRISNLAVRFADDIQKQGNDFNAVGNVIANYIGEGLALGLEAVVGALGKRIGQRIGEIWSGDLVDPITKNLFSGFTKGLTDAIGLTEKAGKVITGFAETRKIDGLNYSLDATTNTIKQIADVTESVPSLAEQLKAAKAKADTEALNNIIKGLGEKIAAFGDNSEATATQQKLLNAGITDFNSKLAQSAISLAKQLDRMTEVKRQTDVLTNVTTDLATQIAYFGDSSEVAAVKQNLLSQRIFDFNSKLAQSAINLAKQLDAMKLAAKVQDEYKDKLKSLSDELSSLRQNAIFEMRFPKATELDKFEEWVRRNTSNFAALRGEINATRSALEMKLLFEDADKLIEKTKELRKLFSEEKTSMVAKHVGDRWGLVEQIKLFGVTDTLQQQQIKNTLEMQRYEIELRNAEKSFGEKRIQELLKIKAVEQARNLELFKTVTLQEKLASITDLISSQGIKIGSLGTVKTELETITQLFADAANFEGINNYAKSLGVTVEQLKNAAIESVKLKDGLLAVGESAATASGTVMSQFVNRIRENLNVLNEDIRTTAQKMADVFTGVMGEIQGVISTAFQNSDGTIQGFFSSVASGFADMVKKIITEMLALLAVAAVAGIITAISGAGFSSGFNAVMQHGSQSGSIGGGILGTVFGGGGDSGSSHRGVGGSLSSAMRMPALAPAGVGMLPMSPMMSGANYSTNDNRKSNVFNVSLNIHGVTDANSFKQSERQIKASWTREMQKTMLKHG
jgi:tape measure domain-containing protein